MEEDDEEFLPANEVKDREEMNFAVVIALRIQKGNLGLNA